MQYVVMVRDRRTGDIERIQEGLLDGLIPEHVVALTTAASADAMGICDECRAAEHCHVLVAAGGLPYTYAKYCPILFRDLFRIATWRVEDLA